MGLHISQLEDNLFAISSLPTLLATGCGRLDERDLVHTPSMTGFLIEVLLASDSRLSSLKGLAKELSADLMYSVLLNQP